MIDSGAEHSVFSTEIAQKLGIELSDTWRVTLQGLGGIVPGFLATVELQLESYQRSTDAIFSDEIAADSGLLGQLRFFPFFSVTFLYSRSDINIRRTRIP